MLKLYRPLHTYVHNGVHSHPNETEIATLLHSTAQGASSGGRGVLSGMHFRSLSQPSTCKHLVPHITQHTHNQFSDTMLSARIYHLYKYNTL